MKITSVCLAFVLGMGVLAAQAPAAITVEPNIVEEDWELHVDVPNLAKNTPQFVTHFEIDGDTFILTTFNFREFPAHEPAGIQMQVWDKGALVATQNVTLNSLNVSGDVVRWTQQYSIGNGLVTARLVGVNSQAWGQNINTSGISHPTNMSTFVTYSTARSLEESHINYGANAVLWYGITETRTFNGNKKLLSNTTDRPVFVR